MALIRCGECGHEVSDKAAACPHCGCPVTPDAITSNAAASEAITTDVATVVRDAPRPRQPEYEPGITPVATASTTPMRGTPQQPQSYAGILAFVVIVACIAGAIGLSYWVFGSNSSATSGDAAQQVATSVDPPAVNHDDRAVSGSSAVCSAIMQTGDATECKVGIHMSGNTIDVRMDTNGMQAPTLCAGIAKQMNEVTDDYRLASRKWSVRIFSPYTGAHPLAVCPVN